jgi:predicted nucleic acid-binding protein
MNAVDTNIFVYALDANEPAKQAKRSLAPEVAEAIGVPVGRVKSRLFRARNAFQQLFPVPVWPGIAHCSMSWARLCRSM